ncbi:MAG: hypothetical protein PHV68_04990 [Candidatus Gastranaerophilales bacterium]|nr:hypothetical protein [Candidatus Gastranaerophilales bacterium]
MDIIVSNENQNSITTAQKDFLATHIKACYTKWDDDRALQLSDIKFIRNCIYNNSFNYSKDWHSAISLPDIYELANTFKAHIWENIISSPETMFDVTGKTPECIEFAPVQKAMLSNAFSEMKINDELENAINNLTETGEAILFVGWQTEFKSRRKYVKPSDNTSKPCFQTDSVVTYDGVKVKSINTENFVFDKSKKHNWQSCPKIFKTDLTLEEVTSNKSFTLTPQTKHNLLSKFSPDVTPNSKEKFIEILEYWGDITFPNGKTLKNQLITVADGLHIIRLENNPYVINPFILASLIEDPASKRGISPLRVAGVLNKISSDILNRQLDALSLITNPPYLAPKGAFSSNQDVCPGKIIEYDSSLLPQSPVPLKFDSALQGWEFISFFKQSIEASTGIFKNMAGQQDGSNRTATEINHTIGGQSVRLNMTIDSIYRKLIIPLVESVADLLANFKFGSENVPIYSNGKIEFIHADDSIRQGDYKYIYGDKSSAQEKKLRFKELYEVIAGFAKISNIENSINWQECFKYALAQYGIQNPEMFINTDVQENIPAKLTANFNK